MYDIVALGELLIDFTPSGVTGDGNPGFVQNPGGAPANVLAAMAKLGKKSAFIGMVGRDQFGRFLRDVLLKNGIAIDGLKYSNTVNTTLAFVHLAPDGDRTFSFYRNPGADMMLTPADVDYPLIRDSNMFHFGSISLTDEPARSATLAAAEFAKNEGKLISYDPNYRPPLWKSEEQAKTWMQEGLKYADIVKVSDSELELLTGTHDPEKGSALLFDQAISVVLITMGPKGCYYRYRGGTGKVETYNVPVVDTTGAGDAFLGGLLYGLSGMSFEAINGLEEAQFRNIVDFANATGALATTRKGAIPAMPSLEEVNRCIAQVPKRIEFLTVPKY